MRLPCVGSGILYELLQRLGTIEVVRPANAKQEPLYGGSAQIKRYPLTLRFATERQRDASREMGETLPQHLPERP